MEPLEATWPDRVLTAQRNWIGRSEGAHVDFASRRVCDRAVDRLHHPPGHPVRRDVHGRRSPTPRWPPSWSPTSSGRRSRPTWSRSARSPRSTGCRPSGPKTGVFLGVHAVNPVTGERIPVWAADYVLADYGTGAIMAVPGQDQRDWEFAKKFDLPIVPHRAAARRLGGRGLQRRGPGDQLRQRRDLPERHGRRRGEARRSSTGWSRRAWARARSTSGCATGC